MLRLCGAKENTSLGLQDLPIVMATLRNYL